MSRRASVTRRIEAAGLAALVLAIGGCARSEVQNNYAGSGGSSDAGTNDGPSSTGGSSGPAGQSGTAGRPGGGGGRIGASSGGTSGAAGAIGAAGAMGAGGHLGTQCYVRIDPVAPSSSSSSIEVGPNVKVRVRGSVINAKVSAPSWRWSITSPQMTALDPTSVDDARSLVEFPATATGKYQIVAQVTNDSTCPQVTLMLTGVRAAPAFNLRVTASGFPVQDTRIMTASLPDIAVYLDPGGTYAIEPREPGQPTVMPAYLRISSPTTTFDLEGYTSHGAVQANLLGELSYDLLVVPSDPTFAPYFFSAVPAAWPSPIIIDQGTPVTALVLGPDGAPLVNARMILKRGARPSTVGISDASGSLTLWTRSGSMSAIVVPPPGSGLPQANVVATSDASVSLSPTADSLSLTMKYQPLTLGALTVVVRDAAGGSALAGALVRISSHDRTTTAGTLTASAPETSDVELTATGSVNAQAVSDAVGNAAFGRLPVGPYDVVIVPPAGSNLGAITSVAVTVPAAGLTQAVSLARKVTLSGVLAPLPGAAGASLTALDKSPDGDGTVVTATANGSGAFALSVDPNRTYQLVVQPVPGQSLGRAVVGAITVGAGDTATGKLTLPRGLALTGTVVGGVATVGGAFVQVFCVSSATSCVDATVSLADAVTRGDGTFSLSLPDPGSQ